MLNFHWSFLLQYIRIVSQQYEGFGASTRSPSPESCQQWDTRFDIQTLSFRPRSSVGWSAKISIPWVEIVEPLWAHWCWCLVTGNRRRKLLVLFARSNMRFCQIRETNSIPVVTMRAFISLFKIVNTKSEKSSLLRLESSLLRLEW